MSEAFKYKITDAADDNSVSVVALDKQVLGGADAIAFRDVVDEFSHSGKTKLMIDLTGVEMMNSSGLGMLISGYSTLKKAGKSFVLINVPDKVAALLKMTKLDTILL